MLRSSLRQRTGENAQTANNFFFISQKLLNWFCFFLPIGFVRLGGVSVTFYFFLAIILQFSKRQYKIFKIQSKTEKLLLLFLLICFISILFAEDTFRDRTILDDVKLLIRFAYWGLLALFLKTWLYHFDIYKLSQYFFYGLSCFCLFFITLNSRFSFVTQNDFSYTLVVCVPFALFYTFSRFNYLINIVMSFVFLYLAYISHSRTGFVLVLGEVLLFLFYALSNFKRFVLHCFLFFIPIVMLEVVEFQNIKTMAVGLIGKDNSDLARLIENPMAVNNRDKSWLTRKLMVQKGLKIFREHPITGIGLGRFAYYEADLYLFSKWLNNSITEYNSKSGHNVYIVILAESGIFAFIAFILIQIQVLGKGAKHLIMKKPKEKFFFLLAFLGMSIYFYVISALTSTITWFVIGAGMATLNKGDTN